MGKIRKYIPNYHMTFSIKFLWVKFKYKCGIIIREKYNRYLTTSVTIHLSTCELSIWATSYINRHLMCTDTPAENYTCCTYLHIRYIVQEYVMCKWNLKVFGILYNLKHLSIWKLITKAKYVTRKRHWYHWYHYIPQRVCVIKMIHTNLY